MIEATIILAHFLINFEFVGREDAQVGWETKVVIGLSNDDITDYKVI
jgi:hypothetical protein